METRTNFIEIADSKFNQRYYFDAYKNYQKALQSIDQRNDPNNHLYCQIGMLECRLATSTIDVSEAKVEIARLIELSKKLQFSLHKELLNRVKKIIDGLNHQKLQADYLYGYAFLINKIIHSDESDDIFDNEDLSSDNKIALEILQLNNVTLPTLLKELEKAINGCEISRVVYENLRLSKSVGACVEILVSLHETLADKSCDYIEDDTLSVEEKIATLKEADEHYKIAIKMLQKNQERESDYAYKSIWMELSRLNILEKLARLDTEHSEKHVKELRKRLTSEEFEDKLSWLNQKEEIEEIDDIIDSHKEFCKEFRNTSKRKNATENAESEVVHNKYQKSSSNKTEVLIETREQTTFVNPEQSFETPLAITETLLESATESLMHLMDETIAQPVEDLEEVLERENEVTVPFTNIDDKSNQQEIVLSQPKPYQAPNTTLFSPSTISTLSEKEVFPARPQSSLKESFGLIIKNLTSALNADYLYSETMREIASFHQTHFASFKKNQNAHAQIIQCLYEKSLVICRDNQNCSRELKAFWQNQGNHLMLKGQTIEESSTRRKHYASALKAMKNEKPSYFRDAMIKYFNRIEEAFPDCVGKIMSDLFNHLNLNKKFIDELTANGNKSELLSIFINAKTLMKKHATLQSDVGNVINLR